MRGGVKYNKLKEPETDRFHFFVKAAVVECHDHNTGHGKVIQDSGHDGIHLRIKLRIDLRIGSDERRHNTEV